MSNYSRKTQLNPPSLPPQHNKPSTCTKNINNLTISIYIDIHVTILTYSTRVRNRVKPITLDHTRRTRDREHNRCWNRLIRKKKKKKKEIHKPSWSWKGMTSNISFEKERCFSARTYLGRVSRYLSQIGEER